MLLLLDSSDTGTATFYLSIYVCVWVLYSFKWIFICCSLKDALNEFIYHRANAHDEDRAMEITYELPQLPEEIEVQHTAKVWSHIWQRCHMWLKDQ